MEMLLMGLVMSLLGVSVSALLFAAATKDETATADARAEVATAPSVFFTDAQPAVVSPPVPVDVLLLQIERHVRVEQAAVEAFLAMPTVESLHTPSRSPLVH